MKQAQNVLFAFCLLALVGMVHEWTVHAQGQTAMTMSGGAAHSTCLTPAAGSYFFCVATDGIWISNNGAAYFQITSGAGAPGPQGIQGPQGPAGPAGAPAASPTISINGTQKTLPASFTISAGSSAITAN